MSLNSRDYGRGIAIKQFEFETVLISLKVEGF